MATITKESIAEAAKLSNMSVNDYIDKLPDNYLQEAAKLSNIDIATYKTKLKEVWGDNAKKKNLPHLLEMAVEILQVEIQMLFRKKGINRLLVPFRLNQIKAHILILG